MKKFFESEKINNIKKDVIVAFVSINLIFMLSIVVMVIFFLTGHLIDYIIPIDLSSLYTTYSVEVYANYIINKALPITFFLPIALYVLFNTIKGFVFTMSRGYDLIKAEISAKKRKKYFDWNYIVKSSCNILENIFNFSEHPISKNSQRDNAYFYIDDNCIVLQSYDKKIHKKYKGLPFYRERKYLYFFDMLYKYRQDKEAKKIIASYLQNMNSMIERSMEEVPNLIGSKEFIQTVNLIVEKQFNQLDSFLDKHKELEKKEAQRQTEQYKLQVELEKDKLKALKDKIESDF